MIKRYPQIIFANSFVALSLGFMNCAQGQWLYGMVFIAYACIFGSLYYLMK